MSNKDMVIGTGTKIVDAHGADGAQASDLPSTLKLSSGPTQSAVMRAVGLLTELRNLEIASQRAEQLELIVAYVEPTNPQLGSTSRGTLRNVLQDTHVTLDDGLSDLVQQAINQRVEVIRATLSTMGVVVDIDTLVNLPTFVEQK